MQSAGHLDYFLCHEQYARYRDQNDTYQWAFDTPVIFEVWRKMADELLATFPDSEYFHIGADEVFLRDESHLQAYYNHIERCAEYLISCGKRVIIWDDMFRKRDIAAMHSLLDKAIINIWLYRELDEKIIKRMYDSGAEVWGASAIQENFFYRGFGNMKTINANEWSKMHKECPMTGHVATVWGRIQCKTPLATGLPESLFMAAYQMEGLKNRQAVNMADFCCKFADQYFGEPALELEKIITNMQHYPETSVQYFRNVPQNNDLMEIWKVYSEINELLNYVEHCFASNRNLLPIYRTGKTPYRILRNFRDGVRITAERIEAMSDKIRTILGKYYPICILNEYIEQRFDGILSENTRWGEVLDNHQANPSP